MVIEGDQSSFMTGSIVCGDCGCYHKDISSDVIQVSLWCLYTSDCSCHLVVSAPSVMNVITKLTLDGI